jgi:predicted nucleotidyltransferase
VTEHRDRVRQVLLDGPPLQIAILFGSRARGSDRPDSDIDLAILPVDSALRWRIARDGIVLLSDPPHAAPRFLARTGIEHDEHRALEVDAMRRYRARLAASHPESTR